MSKTIPFIISNVFSFFARSAKKLNICEPLGSMLPKAKRLTAYVLSIQRTVQNLELNIAREIDKARTKAADADENMLILLRLFHRPL